MPYKSKRTRDLQGEVVAGTGITITEQTKPDGTKEYTITNGDPASAITVDGTGLSLISNVLRNTMAAIMGWSGDDERGAINWTDDNGDTVLKIIPLEELFIGDAHDNNDFIIKHINGENRLIRGTLQIAENINSTGGVSLQTLADNINANAVFQLYPSYAITTDNTRYYFISGGQDIISSDFFSIEETLYNIAGTGVYGIKCNESGIYLISLRIEIKIDSSGVIPKIASNIITIDGTGSSSTIYQNITPVNNLGGGEYAAVFNLTTLLNVDANDVVSVEIYSNNTDITDIYTWSDDPYITIQKVR